MVACRPIYYDSWTKYKFIFTSIETVLILDEYFTKNHSLNIYTYIWFMVQHVIVEVGYIVHGIAILK